MRWFWILAALAMPAPAQPVLYGCGSFSGDYVVGAKLPVSGLFRKLPDGQWQHLGYNNPFLSGAVSDGSNLYLAAGNGVIRLSGESWRVLTGNDITEVREIDAAPGALYYAYAHGIRVSHDGGETWQELAGGLRRKYTEAIRADRAHAGVILAGTEQGVFRTEDSGKTWKLAGAAGLQVMRIEPSPHDSCRWLAATEQGGLFASSDCGKTFESAGRIGVGQNIYDLAFDPSKPGRIALGIWGTGVVVSEDDGKTWAKRKLSPDITTLTFDPGHAGRLYAAVHDDGVYVSDDAGVTWRKDGLDGGHIQRLRFVGGAR